MNSESDYRDPKSLTIAVESDAVAALQKKLGRDPQALLSGKAVRVSGVAQKVKIALFSNGLLTGRFYFQTQVSVTSADQIEVNTEQK